jgi:hypothetical protein
VIEDGKPDQRQVKKSRIEQSWMISKPRQEIHERIKMKEAATKDDDQRKCEEQGSNAADAHDPHVAHDPKLTDPPLEKQGDEYSHKEKVNTPSSSSNRRSLRDELTTRIGVDQNEAKKRRMKKMGEGGEGNPHEKKAKGEEQVFDADYDHDPQLPGRTGTTQAMMERLWAESRGQTVVAIALSKDHPGEDGIQPARKYPRIEPQVSSSNRRSLRNAITDQIKHNQVEAKRKRLEEELKGNNEGLQDNSANKKKKGSATVQGRAVEHRHVHASSKCEFNAISRILATSSGTSSSGVATHNFSTDERG